MTLHAFLEKTGLADRTLRKYHKEGLVPQPGRDGLYGELHYLRVMAIPLLRADGVRGARDVKRALDDMSIEELRNFVEGDYESDTAVSGNDAPLTPAAAAVAPMAGHMTQTGVSFTETHVHIRLRDGIVLDVRMPLDQEGRALVQRIAQMCGFDASFA
jgi:DNA-binding transcriptional MerR regulator